MTSELDGVLPCDSDDIRQVQQRAIEESMRIFQGETVGVSALSSEKYLDELMVRLRKINVNFQCVFLLFLEKMTVETFQGKKYCIILRTCSQGRFT